MRSPFGFQFSYKNTSVSWFILKQVNYDMENKVKKLLSMIGIIFL